MKVGDRVRKDEVLKTTKPTGTIERITQEYVIVVWDDINGHWHYTPEQAKTLEILKND